MVVDLLFSPLFVFLTFLDVFTIAGFFEPFLCASINQHSQLTGFQHDDTMIIYSRFRLFLSCLFWAAGTDPGRSVRPVAKVCSVLNPLYNRPIRLFNGRLDSV